MSVMLIKKETFLRVGKYISLTRPENEAKALVAKFCEFNIRTYEKRYGERVADVEHLSPAMVDFSDVPLAAGIQIDTDFGAIMYNCSDYAEYLDPTTWTTLKRLRKELQATDFYKVSKKYDDYTTYG